MIAFISPPITSVLRWIYLKFSNTAYASLCRNSDAFRLILSRPPKSLAFALPYRASLKVWAKLASENLQAPDMWIMSGETLYLQQDLGKDRYIIHVPSDSGEPPFDVILKHARTITRDSDAEFLQVQNILVRQVL